MLVAVAVAGPMKVAQQAERLDQAEVVRVAQKVETVLMAQ
tara:strand:- start:143 stop:262 length:120 start_codon:yes stop_codon:yes gene_type:complete